MTNLDRAVVRETSFICYRSQPAVIRLEEGGKLVRLRAKGTKTWYTLTIEQLWMLAIQNASKTNEGE